MRSPLGLHVNTTPAGNGTLEVCKAGSVAGSFGFKVDGGATFLLATGQCREIVETAAKHTVVELPDTTGRTYLKSISILPFTSGDSTSVPTRTAVVKVVKGADATVSFTNAQALAQLKVCKIAGDPSLLGLPYSFTETSGSKVVGPFSVIAGPANPANCGGLTTYPVGTNVNIAELASANVEVSSITVASGTASNENLAAGTITATVGTGTTVVTYTNIPIVPPAPGYVEVCKYAGDRFVTGSFNFTISTSNGFSYSQSVPVGQCTGDIQVPAGEVNVAETETFPYYVKSISTIPSDELVTDNLGNATSTVLVASNAVTTVLYTNATQTGLVKACKTLTANSGALVGTTFTFDINSAAGTQSVSLVAAPIGQTACSLDLTAIPLGDIATIVEVPQADVAVTGVSITPPSQNAGSVGSTATLSVGVGVTSATFTDEALGTIEVCKDAADASTATQTFAFSINGGPTIWVPAGQCSQAFQVPAGTATVYEFPSANFSLVSVSTVSPTDPTGARLLTGPTTNPATVAIPFGGVANETVATFTDAVNTGDFKICTQQTSTDANLQGQTAEFDYSYTVDDETSTGTVTLTIPTAGASCSGLIGPIPVVDANGNPIPVTITEDSVSATSVEVTNIDYEGGGTVLSSTPTPAIPPASITFDIGFGINDVTFTNGRTP
jgi:hypothetical protein